MINNNINPHRSNNYRACSIRRLLRILKPFKSRIRAIWYVRRIGTSGIFGSLLEMSTKTLAIKKLRKHLISKYKNKGGLVPNEIQKEHPSSVLEMQFFLTVLRDKNKFHSLVLKKRSKRRKLKVKRKLRKENQEKEKKQQLKGKSRNQII